MKRGKLLNIENRSPLVFFLFLIISAASNFVFGQSYPYKFNYLTADEGLSHPDVNDIAQDEKGYIWIATNFGLDRYDGYVIKRYYNTNVPLNNAFKNRIVRMYPDENGNIWLTTEGGIQYFDVKKEKYVDLNLKGTKTSPGLWKIFKPSGNLLYGFVDYRLKIFSIADNTIEEQEIEMPGGLRFFDMVPDKDGVLYFPSDKGLWMLDKNKKLVNLPISGLNSQQFSRLFIDKNNNFLLGEQDSLFLVHSRYFKKDNKTFKALYIKKKTLLNSLYPILGIVGGKGSEYWINTRTNLIRLDGDLNYIQKIDSESSQHSLNSSVILRTFTDRSECLWVGMSGGGLNYCDLNQKLFYTIQRNPEKVYSLTGNHIRCVLEDGDDLWIGTNANGLNRYNFKNQNFEYLNADNSHLRLKSNVISSLALDNDRNLWIGTGNGLHILSADRKTFLMPDGFDQFPTFTITSLAKDCFGNIWFGNLENMGVIWRDDQKKYHVRHYSQGHYILADKLKPELLFSNRKGLERITFDSKGNIVNSYHYTASSTPNSLSSNYTAPIGKQNDSTYWIGTIGGGLNRLSISTKNNAYSIKLYGDSYNIFKDVETLEVDNWGNIWMGGDGLEYLNPKTGKVIRYDKNDGLQGNSFKIHASYEGASGRLYFGGINGLNYFYPEEIKANQVSARPTLTDILVNNQRPGYGTSDNSKNVIEQAIGYGNNLKLSYLQNNFVILFSAMHFANPLKCQYRYKLEGFDKDWNYTDGKHPSAAYSNLKYESYKFVVEATNNDGVWSKITAETNIIITPPWWESNLAKFIYGLLVVSALVGFYIYQARWYRLKREIEVRAVNEMKREEMHRQREELYQQQLTFFTNISHEFRTPLTLILGPLESLIVQNKNAVLDYSYQLMLRNAKRLINLINELMNFKKVSDSIIKLKVHQLDITHFCNDLVIEFGNMAESKDIDFKMLDHIKKDHDGSVYGVFDDKILEKILLNLLNNSIKYTEPGGKIVFEIFDDMAKFAPAFSSGFELLNDDLRAKNYIYFRIIDTGIGIPKESIDKIFDSFYRVSKDQMGSGVGLALVKSLTKLHKGDIYIYSDVYKGTEIIVGIPWGEENYSELERTTASSEPEARLEAIDNTILAPLPEAENGGSEVALGNVRNILLVDDNYELRTFLKKVFEEHYHIFEADNGEEGLKMAMEKVPDLIISDVMMPVMNGIEFCKLIKDTFETSHIPFIILSAKDALETKIEGLESGADFYFSKPLSIDLLLLTVHNIFEQRERVKLRYTNNYLSEATELVQSEKDKEFFQTLLSLIEDNIQDAELDVEFLCKHLFISRTKLYQKIKSITDQSVGDFIRTVRLKKAIQIMTHEDIAMNKVVDRVGMQSSSNFSRAFKKEYGKSPLQFMQSLRKSSSSS